MSGRTLVQERVMTELVSAVGAAPFDLPQLCRYFSERSPQPMVAVEGATHIIRYLNPAFARLVGREVNDLVGRPFSEAVPEGGENGCLALLDRVLNTGVTEYLAEQEHAHPSPAYWSYAAWAIFGADERPVGVMVQVTDVTEATLFRRRSADMNEALVLSSVRQHELIETIERGERERHALEAQMFQAQKLESLGVLAGGIAHDLNNMLTPVVGFTELVKDALPKDAPVVPMLDAVSTNARRAADLVQQMLAFAGKGQFVVRPLDLTDLVREMAGLLGTAVSTKAVLRYELTRGLPPVEADATQLRQVVMNLVANAAEAVEERGGTVTISTGLVQTAPPAQQSGAKTALPSGSAIFLEVADTGCGMTADVIEKIFDPFFTTKFTGRGLGLAVVQGIARGHRGTLRVHSEPGRGSTFRLILPSSTMLAAAPVGSPRPDEWRGTGTVLVIDDEFGVRDITARILEQAGLTVLVARDGREGLTVFREHQQEIDAVVLDLTMPGMGGLEAAGVLRGLRPNLPVVLVSGFSVKEATLQTTAPGITAFVQKPFNTADLLAAVRRALGQ